MVITSGHVGDPTEGALVVAAAQLGMLKPDLETRWPRVGEIPFTSERKRMTTIQRVDVFHRDKPMHPGEIHLSWPFAKGAVDGLLTLPAMSGLAISLYR